MKILNDAEIRKIVTNADPKRAIEDLVAHYLNLADEVTMECRELRAQNMTMKAALILAAGALEGVTTSTVGPSWKLAQELRTIAGES